MILDETAFATMSEEWQRAAKIHTETWEERFALMQSQQQALRDEGKWLSGPADFLSIIGRSRRETYHCAVLGWLMDPSAPHGLGTRPLAAFLGRAFPDVVFDPDDLARARVRTEVWRTTTRPDGTEVVRRADIVVMAPGLYLVVEAKVDHREDEGQCDDLYTLFHAEDGARFVFLTPRAIAPRWATGPALRAFRCVGFHELRLDFDALKPSDTAPGRSTFESYLQTLRKEFR
jgi:hypothetical protein